MNVTPEMLLFLAERMGLDRIHPHSGSVMYFDGWRHVFSPHQSDAQFGRLVVWAAMEGLWLDFRCGSISVGAYPHINHDSTPDSIRAAAVVAICRALGWEDGNGL